MGGSNSSNKVGGLMINFQKPYYYTGNTVQGNVYINMLKNYKCVALELMIETIEYTRFPDTERVMNFDTHEDAHIHYKKHGANLHGNYESEHPHLHSHHHSKRAATHKIKVMREDSRTIFKAKSILGKFDFNTINKGQYIYPFSFVLPPQLPGSFEYYDNENMAYIKYLITARLISERSREHDKITETILIVRQSPHFFSYPTKLSDTKQITTWCCFNKGSSTLNVSYLKNHFSPDERVQVICDLDNSNCNINAKSIQLQLYQKLILKNSSGHVRFIERPISGVNYDGIYVIFY
jgi:hypothetical protein